MIILSPPAQSRRQENYRLDCQTYKILAATATYSVSMVLWKETAFPLCRAMEMSVIFIINITYKALITVTPNI